MFGKDFVWGAASAAYQVEGAAYEDGRGLSVWDIYCKQPGKIYEGHTGDVACDHYHRYKEDIAIMKELGLKGYRFSISWTRIIPNGIGEVNQKGIEFYNNLIDELLKNGIEPYVTLFHWDYPDELFKKGGWLNRESAEWFAYYAKVVAENFSDRVKYFITLNEPQCFVVSGHCGGVQAPGLNYSKYHQVQIVHNVLLAHGMGVQSLRKYAKQDIKVGYAPTAFWIYPYDEDDSELVEEARRQNFAAREDMVLTGPSIWMDPAILGNYPADWLEAIVEYLPDTWKEDMKTICQPLDFLGQNIYGGAALIKTENGYELMKREAGNPHSDLNWPVEPKGLKWGAKYLYERYKLPIYITENGMCCHDRVSLDGKVHDPNRIDFLNRYLLSLEEAIDEGADVRGYFQWSLTDNFEWTHGYKSRFGLVYIDYETQKRTIKDSGYWYKKVIDTNGEHLHSDDF